MSLYSGECSVNSSPTSFMGNIFQIGVGGGLPKIAGRTALYLYYASSHGPRMNFNPHVSHSKQ